MEDKKKYPDDVRFELDGGQICCTRLDFVDLGESPAGFGNTEQEAYEALLACEEALLSFRKDYGRRGNQE